MRRMTLLVTLLLLSVGGAVPAQTRTLNVGDAVINYNVSGRGRTVVFIHDWAQNITVWNDQVPVFKRHYRVLRYDSRGFGKSTGFEDESAEPQDLLVLLEALHIRHAYIVGHSRGGGVALRFAAAYPNRVDGLVLYGAEPPNGFPIPRDVSALFSSLSGIAQEYGLDSVEKLVLTSQLAWVPPGRIDVMNRYRRLWAAYSGKDLLDPRPQSGRVPMPSVAQLSRLKVPTLVIVGDHEVPFIGAAANTYARRIPGAKKVVIRNAGHGAHFAQSATFNSALLDFFYARERKKKR